MGREIRRVPLDFDHPLDKTWPGFLTPRSLDLPTCPDCDGRGDTPAARALAPVLARITMLADDIRDQERGRPMHPYLRDSGVEVRPSADILELIEGFVGSAPSWLGYGFHAAYRPFLRAAGVPETWGYCPTCNGQGNVGTQEQRDASEAWERTDPPTGEGWQVWETVSEGSPITPVFPTADALVDHLATVGTIWDVRRARDGRGEGGPWRRAAAEQFVKDQWAPTAVANSRIGVAEGGRDADLIAARL